jgi:hypothetical protein
MAQLTPLDFIAKWQLRFQPNTTFEIDEADLQEFATDIADTFGVHPVNVQPYRAGTNYVEGNLVRYAVGSGQEAFYYALQDGKLPAPVAVGDVNWKVVPGPVSATQLSQYISLVQAQNINGDLAVMGRSYQIELPTASASGHAQYLSVVGIAENWLASDGYLVANNVRTKVKNINYVAGTWETDGSANRHDAYTTPTAGAQAIALLDATFVWSVGLRGVQGTLDPLGYGEGWTFANSQIQLLAAANVPAQKVLEIVHNGRGLGQSGAPTVTPGTAQGADSVAFTSATAS